MRLYDAMASEQLLDKYPQRVMIIIMVKCVYGLPFRSF